MFYYYYYDCIMLTLWRLKGKNENKETLLQQKVCIFCYIFVALEFKIDCIATETIRRKGNW